MKSNRIANRQKRSRQIAPVWLPTSEVMLSVFDDFLRIEVAASDAASDTIRTYQRRIIQFLSWCEGQKIAPATATSEDIKTYRYYLLKKRKQAATTIALTLVVIRRFYEVMLKKGLVKSNPALGVKPPTAKKDSLERISYLELSELKQLLAVIPQSESVSSLRDLCLVPIMALHGARTVELHRANVGDLIVTSSGWSLRLEGKGGKLRTIPLRKDVSQMLEQYLAARKKTGEKLTPSTPLFISSSNRFRGQRLSRRGIRYLVDLYLEKADLKYTPGRTLSAHSLRHTAGTLGLAGGASLRAVQDLLGHSDPKTTAIYAHVLERHESNPANKIDIQLLQPD